MSERESPQRERALVRTERPALAPAGLSEQRAESEPESSGRVRR